MTAEKTLCHLHEAGACYEGCPYAYSLLETLPAPLAALRATTAKAVKAGGAIYAVEASSPAHDDARAYYALCDRARALGIPTSLDDPASPTTVAGLEAAVAAAESHA